MAALVSIIQELISLVLLRPHRIYEGYQVFIRKLLYLEIQTINHQFSIESATCKP